MGTGDLSASSWRREAVCGDAPTEQNALYAVNVSAASTALRTIESTRASW